MCDIGEENPRGKLQEKSRGGLFRGQDSKGFSFRNSRDKEGKKHYKPPIET